MPASTSPTRSPTRWFATGSREDDARSGFLLDGYPRTVAQVDELDDMLAEEGSGIDAVVVLTVEKEEIVQRLLKRAEIEGRADDTEEVIRRRMDVYTEQTAPLLAVYADHGSSPRSTAWAQSTTSPRACSTPSRRRAPTPADVPRPRGRDQDP